MTCIRYTLTNTGLTSINFSYRRCDDSMWEYQVELLPNQTKNIWFIENTFNIAKLFLPNLQITDLGPYAPIPTTPTPTPTISLTPQVTTTPTVTPTNTSVSRYFQDNVCHTEYGELDACNCPGIADIWTDGIDFASSTVAFANPSGPNTGDPFGYYAQNGIVYLVATGCGIGCTSGSSITVFGSCGPTPTPTITPTNTPTQTITPSPTEPVRYNQYLCHNEIDGFTVCDCPGFANVWTDGVNLASSTVMFSDPSGPNTGNPFGYYLEDGIIYQVANDCGVGCTTGATITFYNICGPTPTPTVSPTVTSTLTPTPTPNYNYYYLLDCDNTNNKIGRSIYSGLTGTYNVDVNKCYFIIGSDPGPSFDYDLDTSVLVTDCNDMSCVGLTTTPTPTESETPTPTPSFTPTVTPS